jgi:apolipoprotein N-acyltransferase
LYGLITTNPYFASRNATVRVAGISANNIPVLQTMYEDAYGTGLLINEDELTQTSPELAELNKGFVRFIENPFNKKFSPTLLKFIESQDSLFAVSRRETVAGSKIISWSEAAAFTLKSDEELLFAKGEKFSKEQGVYFLMTVASIIPGKVEIGKKFIENKALLFDPSGKVLNVFFKNRPVPLVEPSVAGDGTVPVIATPYGNLAISICYDADFPFLMRQAGEKDADILLIPSGDWREVSPYHGQMASVRAIENGASLLRPVSGARSIATDFSGNVIGGRDYEASGDKVIVAYLPVKGVNTLYTIIGDSFAWLCIIALIVLATMTVLKKDGWCNRLFPSNGHGERQPAH